MLIVTCDVDVNSYDEGIMLIGTSEASSMLVDTNAQREYLSLFFFTSWSEATMM